MIALIGIALDAGLLCAFPHFNFPAAPSFVAIVATALTWGMAPALCASLVSAALVQGYVIPARAGWRFDGMVDAAGFAVLLVSFVAVSIVASIAGGQRRQLAAERAQLAAIFEAMSDGVVVGDAAGRVVRANRAMHRIVGAERYPDLPAVEQALHQPAIEAYTSLGAPLPLAQLPITRLLSGEIAAVPDVIDLRFHALDGSLKAVEVRVATVPAAPSQLSQMVATYRDVTTQRQLERSLEGERERLQQVLELLPEAVQLVDATGLFIFSNRAATAILGQDLVGLRFQRDMGAYQAYGLRHADGTPYAAEETPLQRALHHGAETRGEQLLLRNAVDGRDIPVLMNAVPLRDSAGAIVGSVAVYQDISAIRDLERQRDEFVATVSHDLKNPLTTIVGTGQLLRRRAVRLPEAERDRFESGIATIEATALRMARQIGELLDVARLQMGRPLDLDPQPTDLIALLRRLIETYARATERHTIQLDSGEDQLIGQVDASRLERALSNLLDNAIKYSPDGGPVTVSLVRADGPEGSWATIRIADRGVGIPPADLPHVFERFFRASNVVGQIRGSGIGLAGVRQIVEQHGGAIEVESGDTGTTFTVRIPLDSRGADHDGLANTTGV